MPQKFMPRTASAVQQAQTITDKLAHPNAALGKNLVNAAAEERRKEMQDTVVQVVKSLMIHKDSLETDIFKQTQQLQLIERRLAAIEAGEFSLNPRTAEIRFDNEELR